jgi:hypothetical protein
MREVTLVTSTAWSRPPGHVRLVTSALATPTAPRGAGCGRSHVTLHGERPPGPRATDLLRRGLPDGVWRPMEMETASRVQYHSMRRFFSFASSVS